MLPRLALNLVVHVVMAALAVGAIAFLTRDETCLLPALVTRLFSDPASLATIRGEAAGHVMIWAALAVATSFVMAGAWILFTERANPLDADGARSRVGSWAGLLIVAVIVAAVIGYMQIYAAAVNLTLNTGTIVVSAVR